MLTADRLAELQDDSSRAASRAVELANETETAGRSALASLGTAAQEARFVELLKQPTSFAGDKSSPEYQRLAALRAISGAPTAEDKKYAEVAWEAEKARRTAEDPTWSWGRCRLNAEGDYASTDEMRAEPQVDPKECERRKQLHIQKRQAQFEERLLQEMRSSPLGELTYGLTKAGDFLVKNVFGSLPFAGRLVGEAYKAFAPPGSEFYDYKASTEDKLKRMAKGVATDVAKVGAGKVAERLIAPHRNTINAAVERAKTAARGRLHSASRFAMNKVGRRATNLRLPNDALMNVGNVNNVLPNNAVLRN